MNIRKIALAAVITVFIFQGTVQAANTSIGVNIGRSELEGWVDTQLNPYDTPLTVGAGYLYSDDDYWIANAHMTVKDEVFIPGLSLGLGFRGVLGEVEIYRRDYDVGAFCLQVLGDYDFRKNTTRLPISISASISGAPEILSFRDTERYVEFATTFNFHINNWATAFAGYRKIDIEFDKPVARDWDDDSIFGGIKLSF
ncbi:MAG: hypothetical protein B6I22_10725 [Desulfobacteraceae bacterium 4572_123]|nr:MAG: hypothetical protein B6I22_10725 [Desulfobacteraceae bacterium 4572_123]